MGYIAAACALVIVALPAVASAQSTQDRLASTRSALDRAADRWFAAQNKVNAIDTLIAQRVHDIDAAQARADALRHAAVSRARLMYEGASIDDYMTILGGTAMDTARRAQLIEKANARDNATVADLTASLEDLRIQKEQLTREHAREKDALDSLASERRALDTQLSALRAEAAREAAAAAERNAAAARDAAARQRLVAAAQAVQTSDNAPPTAPPTAPPSQSGSSGTSAPTPPPPPTSGGTNPHHNDPFLVCTRARESSGDYSVVSADGLYYGAYQFLRSTWDLVAAHAGRNDLIGVPPNRASAYDQDEMAWTLYQWQGKAPWGGRC
jgi:peptidoglycan hydrolase CwlO-like protein